ncbi:MAG: MBL fold metallo-hydrolase [Desulfurococcales archaeon ex4484_204]|nr:MAG: MBL fold metallo-hydrolase [Desulfurococcales archaeon ex4484_204]
MWFDSLGAKSSSTLITTPYVNVLIDPGVAIMHPTFPASWEDKVRWAEEGFKRVLNASRRADVVVITHYHYDHYTDFERGIYEGKEVIVKDPNQYINESQRGRALNFLESMVRELGGEGLEEFMTSPLHRAYGNPLSGLVEATSRDFGDYSSRRAELLGKGLKWFRKLSSKWASWRWVKDFKLPLVSLAIGDGRSFKFGGLELSLSTPRFHGVEFSRVGWVVSVGIRCCGFKVLYTSDLNGPIIEDYATSVLRFEPDLLILDGPPTYLLGYTLNRINLGRAVDNGVRIVNGLGEGTIVVYDHHLAREPRFRERTSRVWETSRVRVGTAAEFMGRKPVVVEVARK